MSEKPLQTKVVRFGLVGLANTGIDFAIFAAVLAMGTPPLAANVLSWLGAVLFSYGANSRWTFERDTALGEARSVVRFLSLGALVTLAVSSSILVLFGEIIGVLPAKILGLVISTLLNFAAARWSIEDRVL